MVYQCDSINKKITYGHESNYSDTIAATATPLGRGGVAIIRVSGKKVTYIAEYLLEKSLRATSCYLFFILLMKIINVIDKGLAIFFNGPHSFTGEDILELHGHGGPAVMDLFIATSVVSLGARLAMPGEFSERAFLNGKIDLVQAEAIADLIDSASEQAATCQYPIITRRIFKKNKLNLLKHLIRLRTYIEASIDFAGRRDRFFE